MRASRGKPGFTLIETLIVLAILAAVAALVLPGTVSQLRSARFDQASQQVLIAADTCRSQAIRRSAAWELVLVSRGAETHLAMQPAGMSAVDAGVSVPPTPVDAQMSDVAPTSESSEKPAPIKPEDLLTLPEGVTIQAGAAPDQTGAATTDRPETDAEATSTSGGSISGSGSVLAVFLPDGSVIAAPFELRSKDRTLRAVPMFHAGRFSFRVVDQSTGRVPESEPSTPTEVTPAPSSSVAPATKPEAGP